MDPMLPPFAPALRAHGNLAVRRRPMPLRALLATVIVATAGCAATQASDPGTMDIKLIAFNDLHGNLEVPGLSIQASDGRGGSVAVPAGGAAYLASAIAALKARNPLHAVVSAGDLIGASPLVSSLFLDEPTIEAVNAMKIDFAAVGNHEFDKGRAELLRMQHGGCERHTALAPCQVAGHFAGANFGFLAANVVQENGATLFPATGMKSFSQGGARVKVGFIGMTLKGTPTMVTPSGVAGLRFQDEADTANALVSRLKAEGADAIVVVLHEGGVTDAAQSGQPCDGLRGDIVPILQRLSPAVDVVVSGHTHRDYICDYGRIDAARPFLLTSAGRYGTLLTDIDLTIDLRARKVVAKHADNVIVQGEAYTRNGRTVELAPAYPAFEKNDAVAALVSRYAAAAAPLAQRPAGFLPGPVTRAPAASGESALGNLLADAQLAATRPAAKGGARLALMNPGGVRADLVPDASGEVRYGQLFSAQPFGNSLVVKTLTGAELKAVLEQQFASGSNTTRSPRVLSISHGFGYSYDLGRNPGARVFDLMLDGRPVTDGEPYRVAMNSFLAAGGDNFTLLAEGRDALGGDQDLDALEAYLRAGRPLAPPATNRISNLTR
jgi:5'-nucleotidase